MLEATSQITRLL